jgi:L-ascorbate metabolism protein UlaG (beta-lactamase superfamily)
MTDSAGSLTFIGTATTLIRIGGFTVLTDPNFLHRGDRAYLGRGLWSRRLTNPAMELGDLPPLDAVVLSHLHGDHFDRVARRGLDRAAPVVTTPHAARRLGRWGFTTYGLPTWDAHVLRHGTVELSIAALPAVHAFGLMGKLLPPVMGSLLQLREDGQLRLRAYLTGDTLLGAHLEQIHRRFPDIDVAVVHLGGTRVLGALVTMDAAQGTELLRRVQPRAVVPVHYDDYGVFTSPLQDFQTAVDRAGFADRVTYVMRGDTVPLPVRQGQP